MHPISLSGRPDSAVTISVLERTGRTHATAELDWAGQHLAGTGIAYYHPSDYLVPEAGRDLATARALSDLADRLMAANARGIAAIN